MGATPTARLTRGGRPAALMLAASSYAPWWAQRRMHSIRVPIRVVVAGRQAGKTHAAAEEVVRVMLARPGTTSCLLMPTYKSTKGPLKHLRRAFSKLGPSGGRWRWLEVDKCFKLSNGAELYVRTADDTEGVPTRGLTVDGILWVDEAAYVPREPWEAARFTQSAVQAPLALVTGSPCGRNWLWEEFNSGIAGAKKSPMNESFRFRTTDSPYHNPEFVADQRTKMTAKKFAQEINAEFLGDANAAFDPEDVAAMFVPSLTIRGEQKSLGIDLGKEQDFTVVTLMNEFGEAWVLGRWRDVGWPEQEARLAELAKRHGAVCVIDMGRGGGYGGVMLGYLERTLGKGRCLGVRTASEGVKGEVVELLMSDVENHRLRAQADERGQILRHEMTFFEAHRTIVGGVERWKYHGPEGVARDDEDEESEDHDDCVISLGLANWGRVHGWERDTGDGGLADFRPAGGRPAPGGARPAVRGGGYIFR